MSTSGGFTPPAAPECPYAPRMTRAQALTLRTAGGLRENCVVVVTDGPTIGTAGNTSATEIELNPTGPSDLGQTARVHTTFDTNTAWHGLYDIDLGTAGSITELTDSFNNTVTDPDADSPTVHTQFPWHRGGANLRDNTVDNVTLPGWDTAGGTLTSNVLRDTTVDLTGKTSGTFDRNTIVGGSFTSNVAAATIANNTLTGATVNQTAASTGTFNFQNNTMRTGTFTLDGTGASQITANDFTGTTVNKAAGSGGLLFILNSSFGNSTITIGATNGSSTVFGTCRIGQGTFTLNGPVALPAQNNFQFNGTVVGSFIVSATATAGLAISGGFYSGSSVVTQNRTAGTNPTGLFDCDFRGASTFTDNGTTNPVVGLAMNRSRLTDSVVTFGNMGVKTAPGTCVQQLDAIGSTLNVSGLTAANFLDKGRLLGASLTNAGFKAQTFELVGLTKTMTADQPNNRLGNIAFDNWI